MKVNIDDLTPRELAMSLMRGDRVDMKLGYSAEAAARVAARRAGWIEDHMTEIPTPTADENVDKFWRLLAFCQGWENGVADGIEASDPSTRFERRPRPEYFGFEEFDAGIIAGHDEAHFLLYPTLARIERAGYVGDSD